MAKILIIEDDPAIVRGLKDTLEDESYEVLQEDEGFGLANVNTRIKLYYGSQYGLSIESQYQQGTRVTVTIPLRELGS